VKSEYGFWEAAKSGIENLRKRGLIKQNVANRMLKEDRVMGFDEVTVKGENLS
jgi:MoaA/NifB/PqqE/SkfB family radical SAM enzyme